MKRLSLRGNIQNKYRLLLCAGVCLLFIWGGMAMLKGPASNGILYEVTGGKNRLTVLGSIHVGTQDMLPYGDTITEALTGADKLILECDTAAGTESGSYPEGDTLTDHIDPDLWQALREVFPSIGLTEEKAQTMKPWAICSVAAVRTTMQRMKVRRVSDALKYGVENTVMTMAGDKDRLYLETPEAQYRAMDRLSPALQEYLLWDAVEALRNPEGTTGIDADMASWPRWWKEGNANAFAQSYQKEMEDGGELLAEYHRVLNRERNVGMAARLAEWMEQENSGDLFAVIGLMHLTLPGDSVLSELERMGYHVRQILPGE